MVCCDCERIPGFSKGVLKTKPEKYEAPEVEFVEIEEDVVTASTDCPEYEYGNTCIGSKAP